MNKHLLRSALFISLLIGGSPAESVDQQGYLDARKTYRVGAGIGGVGVGTILLAAGVEQVDMTQAVQEPAPTLGYSSYGLLAAGTVGPFATEVDALFLGIPAAYATAIVPMSPAK